MTREEIDLCETELRKAIGELEDSSRAPPNFNESESLFYFYAGHDQKTTRNAGRSARGRATVGGWPPCATRGLPA